MTMISTLPCIDSDEQARILQRNLDIPRDLASRQGHEALEAISSGFYMAASGTKVDWSVTLRNSIEAKQSIPPGAPLSEATNPCFLETQVQVANETTLEASHRLVMKGFRPLALNFANGIHPGGGFQSGARAQEEALCRSSALFATLNGDPMYAAHLKRSQPDSSDWAILSPNVPVFRADDGSALETPWLLDFISSAAPVATSIGKAESARLMDRRINRILSIAQAYDYEALVLGAWGCGAFGNDGLTTARSFRAALEGEFSGAFSRVVFAITDWSSQRAFLGPFKAVFNAA